jgi:hypothetical protein
MCLKWTHVGLIASVLMYNSRLDRIWRNLVWTSCRSTPPQIRNFLFPTIDNNNMKDARIYEVENMLTPLNPGPWNDVQRYIFEKYATFVKIIILQNTKQQGGYMKWRLCVVFGLMTITNEPLELETEIWYRNGWYSVWNVCKFNIKNGDNANLWDYIRKKRNIYLSNKFLPKIMWFCYYYYNYHHHH